MIIWSTLVGGRTNNTQQRPLSTLCFWSEDFILDLSDPIKLILMLHVLENNVATVWGFNITMLQKRTVCFSDSCATI